jgi:hypothetical protein
MQIGTGYILSAALHVVARLRIADLIGDGPAQPVATLAQKAGVSEDSLHRVLRALSMVGIFTEAAPRTFALTPAANLLRADVPGSLRNMAVFMPNPLHFRVYAEMMHAVESGKTASEKVFGMPPFEFLAKNPEESAVFNDAMTSFSAGIIPAVLDAYDFSAINVLADIAGGHGIGGDFFASVPGGADAYLMKHIIHDWDDQRSEVILGNVHRALAGRAGGKVILLEAVITAGNDPDFAKVLDLEMMVFPGGRERTEAEFAALFARTGFELTRIVPTKSPVSVIEARAR